MNAQDIMSTELAMVHETASISLAEALATSMHIRHLPIEDDSGNLVGLISLRDILQYFSQHTKDLDVCIQKVMSRELFTVSTDDSLKAVAQMMIDHDVSCIPVVRDKTILGVITERDFVKIAAEQV